MFTNAISSSKTILSNITITDLIQTNKLEQINKEFINTEQLKNDEYQTTSNTNNASSQKLLDAIKEEFNLINNISLKFAKDEETGQTYVEIVDKQSGKVVREIPPEVVRELAEKLDEMVGLLFDKSA